MRTVSKKMKLILLLMVMMFAVIPVQAAAPAKVIKAAEKCINENNRCIVVDNTAGRVYLLKKCKGKWTVKKDFRCTVGDRIDPKKHYHLLRNGDTDKAFYYEGGKMYSYGIGIDCYEEAPVRMLRFHSYGEKGGRTYKSVKYNPNGIGMCIDNAYYIWRYYGNGTAVMGVD